MKGSYYFRVKSKRVLFEFTIYEMKEIGGKNNGNLLESGK